jgi:hypothetical protein
MRQPLWTLSIPNLTLMSLLLSLNYLIYRKTSRKLIRLWKRHFIKRILTVHKFREKYRGKFSICVTSLCKVNSKFHLQSMINLILKVNQQRQMNSCKRDMWPTKFLSKFRASRFKIIINPYKNKRREKTAFLRN